MPPGRGSAAGPNFLTLPYYSQRAVFASLRALFPLLYRRAFVRAHIPDNIVLPGAWGGQPYKKFLSAYCVILPNLVAQRQMHEHTQTLRKKPGTQLGAQ